MSLGLVERLVGTDLDAVVHRAAVPPDQAAAAFAALRSEIPWRQDHVTVFGRTSPIPRLQAWIADEGLTYTYSGIDLAPQPWTPATTAMRLLAEEMAGCALPSLLANLYRDGSDSVGWHADDEPELGDRPTIVSISLGATRRFGLKRRDESERLSVDLADGDVLVMSGPTQEHWLHQLSKTTRGVGERINLTFRPHINA